MNCCHGDMQDGHEICFVGDEAFRELSQADPKADRLIDEVCRTTRSLKHSAFICACVYNNRPLLKTRVMSGLPNMEHHKLKTLELILQNIYSLNNSC